MPSDELRVLLVGQCLDGGRVERLLAASQRQMDRKLADEGLAGPGRRSDKDALPGLQRRAGLQLEGVRRERQGRQERLELAHRRSRHLDRRRLVVGRRHPRRFLTFADAIENLGHADGREVEDDHR